MINKIIIKVKVSNYDKFIEYTWKNNINIYNIKKEKEFIICIINDSDYDNLSKIYDIEIIKTYSKKSYINLIKNNIINIIIFIYAIILFIFFSNIIVDVKINIENKNLLNNLTKILEEKGIKRMSLKKDYLKLQVIKNEIVNAFNDDIEWIEIESIGMTYNVKIELRKKEIQQKESGRCHIIAKKSGIVKEIEAEKGDVLTENNSYVNKGDILISGEIKYNEEVKGETCAKGYVYAERWYNVSISMPTKK